MNEPSDDRALEAALRALETPSLAAADRAAIRAALRTAGARAEVDPLPAPPARVGRLPSGRHLVLAAAGIALTAAGWRVGRGPIPVAEPPPLAPLAAATTVVRTTAVALAVPRGGLPATAPPDPTPAPAIDHRPSAVDRSPNVVPPFDLAPPTTDGRPPIVLPLPTDAQQLVDAPRSRHGDEASRPTATPGPVLPLEPTRESPPPTPTGAGGSAPTIAPSSPTITGIAGTVRLGGAPLAFAAVRAVPADGGDGAFVVGSSGVDGAYVLRLAPGAWRVVAEGEGRPARWWPAAARVEEAAVVVVVAGAVTGGIDFELR